MDRIWHWVLAGIVCVALGAGGFYWWYTQSKTPRVVLAPVAEAPPAPAPAPSAPAEPAIRHPIEEAPAASKEQPLPSPPALPRPAEADAYVKNALIEALGRAQVFSFLNTDNFPGRVVATVDNLARQKASSSLWPVVPIGGRFSTEQRGDGTHVSASNASRYAPFVRFVEAIDSAKVAALYLRLYPMFQRAYEEQGYPGKYFNDRLVDVIDHLLQTPEPPAAPKVTLTEVKGPIKPARPWAAYEFADPNLEARSAGQKILMRMGSANAQRLKAKLREFRAQIAKR
jgi:Protein of unknown function (DUF3014)